MAYRKKCRVPNANDMVRRSAGWCGFDADVSGVGNAGTDKVALPSKRTLSSGLGYSTFTSELYNHFCWVDFDQTCTDGNLVLGTLASHCNATQ